MVSLSCKPQASQNGPSSNISLNQSFITLMKYCDTHLYELSADSLAYYGDSIFRYSYSIDTSGSNSNSLMIKLLEQALKKDQKSTKAAIRLFNQYTFTKQYEKALNISTIYLNDSSDHVLLLEKSMIYYKIGEKGKANSGFKAVRSRCEKLLTNPYLKKDYYLGHMWNISMVIFIQESKEKSLLNFKSAIDKYPDDLFVSGLYEKIEGYNSVNDLIDNNLP